MVISKYKCFLALVMGCACLASTPNLSADSIRSPCHHQSTVRAAIDFGSGAIKIQAAVVDIEKNCLIGEPLLERFVPLGLTEDVAAHDGYISDEMQQRAFEVLRSFKEEVAEKADLNNVEFTAVATAVFRRAKNGRDILRHFEQTLGVRFQILPQDEEGELGFLTAKALYPEISSDDLLSWDSGNGSFQIAGKENDNLEVYEGPLGHGTVRVMLSKNVRSEPILKAHESGNPISRHEALELANRIRETLPPTPEWLHRKLAAKKTVIVTFGDGESIFALVAQAVAVLDGTNKPVQKAMITLADVQRVIHTYIEAGDEAFDAAGLHRKTLTSALQLATVMEYFGIDAVQYSRSVGSTPGMLIAPQLWIEGG